MNPNIHITQISDEPPPAYLALHAEGFDPVLWRITDKYSYGRMYAELWRREESFIVIEHDIIPGPGCIDQFILCEEPHCGFHYVLGTRGWIGGSIGCVKYSTELIREHLYMADVLPTQFWLGMDGYIEGTLPPKHWHKPAVAHARSLVTWNKQGKPVLRNPHGG